MPASCSHKHPFHTSLRSSFVPSAPSSPTWTSLTITTAKYCSAQSLYPILTSRISSEGPSPFGSLCRTWLHSSHNNVFNDAFLEQGHRSAFTYVYTFPCVFFRSFRVSANIAGPIADAFKRLAIKLLISFAPKRGKFRVRVITLSSRLRTFDRRPVMLEGKVVD